MKSERVVRGSVTSDHIVELFDTQAALAQTVAAFLDTGYRNGDTLLVVARSTNWNAIEKELEGLGCPVDAAIGIGRLMVLNAAETMSKFMRRGSPSPELFHEAVTPLIARLSARRRLRIYGEMVDVLAEEGNLTAALALERVWNDVANRFAFTLLCGYSAAHFSDADTRAALKDICHAHTHVNPAAVGTLGSWVMYSAPGAPRPQIASAVPTAWTLSTPAES